MDTGQQKTQKLKETQKLLKKLPIYIVRGCYLLIKTVDIVKKMTDLKVLGFTRIETRVVSCIIAFSSCCLDFTIHVLQPFAMLFFPAFSHIISACLIMQTNFIFQQMKLHVQKSENGAPQNYQSKFREVTCFEEVNLSHTRASKFQPLA